MHIHRFSIGWRRLTCLLVQELAGPSGPPVLEELYMSTT